MSMVGLQREALKEVTMNAKASVQQGTSAHQLGWHETGHTQVFSKENGRSVEALSIFVSEEPVARGNVHVVAPNSILERVIQDELEKDEVNCCWGDAYEQTYSRYTQTETPQHTQSEHVDTRYPYFGTRGVVLPAFVLN